MAMGTVGRREAVGVAMVMLSVGGMIAAWQSYMSGYVELRVISQVAAIISAFVGVAGAGLAVSFLPDLARSGIVVVAALVAFTPPLLLLGHSRHAPLRTPSRGYIGNIIMAMDCYRTQNGEHFPYDERGPMESMALLYPGYIDNPTVFRSTYLYAHWGHRNDGPRFPAGTVLAGKQCHFGYTWRVPRDAPSDFAIVAETPDMFIAKGDRQGYYVGKVGGWVSWHADPFCSYDPNDNIYAPQPGWSADTDSFIRTAK